MRFTRHATLAMFIGAGLMAPAPAPAAASKEMQELQRDVAAAQDQITAVGKSVADLRALVQQALDTANKTNGSVNSLNSGLMQTMQSGLKGLSDQLNSVTGLSSKVSGIGEDVSNLQSSMKDLQMQVNRQGQALTEILNQVKLLQAPAAAPPSADGSAPGGAAPPPSGQTLFNRAMSDSEDSSKRDLAVAGYREFLRLYPNDQNAITAQYNLGNVYYAQGKMDEAVAAFDAAIEQYPSNDHTTPGAYYMKGMALKTQKKTADAKASFNAVIKNFPKSEEAEQARAQLRLLGGAPVAPARKSH